MSKVLIACPSYDGKVRHEVVEFVKSAPYADWLVVEHLPTDVARNQLVMAARARKAEVLVMIDADAAPSPNTCHAICQPCFADVVVCGVPYLTQSGAPCPPGDFDREGLQVVDCLGTNLVAYNMSVFDRVPAPWFEYSYTENHSGLMSSEDFIFHEKLVAAFIPLLCHFGFWCAHVVQKTYLRPRKLTPEIGILLGWHEQRGDEDN